MKCTISAIETLYDDNLLMLGRANYSCGFRRGTADYASGQAVITEQPDFATDRADVRNALSLDGIRGYSDDTFEAVFWAYCAEKYRDQLTDGQFEQLSGAWESVCGHRRTSTAP